jgi:hypothetical protein
MESEALMDKGIIIAIAITSVMALILPIIVLKIGGAI